MRTHARQAHQRNQRKERPDWNSPTRNGRNLAAIANRPVDGILLKCHLTSVAVARRDLNTRQHGGHSRRVVVAVVVPVIGSAPIADVTLVAMLVDLWVPVVGSLPVAVRSCAIDRPLQVAHYVDDINDLMGPAWAGTATTNSRPIIIEKIFENREIIC